MATSKKIIAAICDCIAAGPERQRNVLAQAIEDFADKYPRQYGNMLHSKIPFLRDLFTDLEEACDTRVPGSDNWRQLAELPTGLPR